MNGPCKILLLCLLGLIGMDVGLASIIRRSGSYPGSICTATLKNNHGHNAGARFSWMLWKTKTVPWQRMFPPGTRGKKEVALFLNDKMQCTATFWVDTKTCSIKDDHCHQSPSTCEKLKHTSQPSLMVEEGTPTKGPIQWKNCPAGMFVHVDF
ncbi:hypothetical protein PTTG_03084 [Puccinia triticina 1-1 BBBD Race 1]|uniref:Secreted protein n=2 Tax=Puccinia triticina TaxID=208348 RepID=A0A0C4EQM3_PUCT1|nr:uncharacterized protein PtA15_12A330 [Puccinia triticina]OAV94399.1 hypothetical protein PTTG_03084 [Puccinia triticina 1-1 BBBD Race 1]WAQ90341.1 hypothetical protein PtA15_12A330 [Puccinia triticina]